MDVILLQAVGTLGHLGDRVTVKPGFGRNFLIPYGKAVAATKANIAEFEARREELEAASKERYAVAESRAAELEGFQVAITAKAGDEGKLFGSIGTRDIAEALSAAGRPVEKSEVKLPEGALRELGEYEISIQVHADVFATIKLAVVAESE